MRHYKRLLLLAVSTALLISLCACGGGNNSPQDEGNTTPSTSPEQAGTVANTDEPSASGGSVTVGIAQDLDTLDPHKAVAAGTEEVLFNIFEGLVKPSPDGAMACAVASDYELSEDSTTYTFHLREGVKFHNGDPVTVEDVIYSLERCAGSENDGTPLVTAFSNISEIYAADDNTVVVVLDEPTLEFIYSMKVAIIPKDSGDSIGTNPIGTGPFKYVSYSPQESMVVERNDDYWDTPASLEQVTFRIITSTETLVMSLQSGALDMVIHMPNTVRSEVEQNFTVLQDTMKLVQALYLNNNVKPFDDLKVRQAMYYAINVNEIIDLVCNGDGIATGTSMYPAYQEFFMPELAETYPHDVEKAKEMLAEAGYADGFDMTITVPSNYTQHMQTAEVIASQLAQAGIRATIAPVEWETWVSDIYRGREYESTVCAIAASDMTAREMLIRYVSDNQKNFINFNNAEYDTAVATAVSTLDEAEQVAQYKRAEEILNEEAASIWIQDLCELVVMNPALEGYTFYRTYVLDMSTISYK